MELQDETTRLPMRGIRGDGNAVEFAAGNEEELVGRGEHEDVRIGRQGLAQLSTWTMEIACMYIYHLIHSRGRLCFLLLLLARFMDSSGIYVCLSE